MSELAAKLNKRRSIVEEGGLHFESTPLENSPNSVKSSDVGADVQKRLSQAVVPKLPPTSGGGADLQSALNKRRATVDGDGETFESKPAAKVADCEATAAGASAGANAVVGRSRTSDLRAAMEKQRASVDEGGLHFESQPQAKSADYRGKEAGSGKQEEATTMAEAEVAKSEAEPDAEATQKAAEEEKAREAEARELAEQAEKAEKARELEARELAEQAERVEKAQAAASLPTPSRACGPQPGAEEQAEAERAEEAEEEQQHAEEEEEEAEEEAVASAGANGMIKRYANRITWLVGLRSKPLPDVIESSPFEIGSYGPVTLQLRHNRAGAGLTLTLCGASPRPASLRVALFAAKGWAKRSLVAWPEGEDLEERFDIDMTSRSSILCGLVHQP